MKTLHRWPYGLGLILALLTIGWLWPRQSPAPAASRFAPLAPAGSSVAGQGGAAPVSPEQNGPIEIMSIQNDVSKPLASIPPSAPNKGALDPDQNNLLALPGHSLLLNDKAQLDAALQTALIGASMPAPIANFDGLTNLNGAYPPDANGDVGPNHYMQWVNLSFAIYSKTGTLLYGPANGNTLWAGFGGVCQTSNNGDPIVQYDHLADRWLVSQFAVPGGASGYHQCVAVSQTGDPTGAWYRYDFLWDATNMNDYPHFGVWPDGYYMTVHEFANGASWAGQGVAVFERDKLLLGQAARVVKFNLYSTDPNMGGMLPSDLDGPAPAAGTPNYFVEPDDNAGGFPQDQIQVWGFHVDWTNTANSTFTLATTLPTAAFDSNMCGGARSCIPQPGTAVGLDAIADRAMYRAQYRNFGAYQTIVLNQTVDATSADRAGLRWYELRNPGSGWAIYQQSTFSPDATQRWMGSVAMDSAGNLALGYSASDGVSVYPSIRYTGRLAGDALGSLTQGEVTMTVGTGVQTGPANRWGDYSMLAVDSTDGCTFWYTNEYIQTTGGASWKTRIGSFKFPSCAPPSSGALTGTVTNADTSAPIFGALVSAAAPSGSGSALTNASGQYTITNLLSDTYTVTAAALGYVPASASGVSVTGGLTLTQDFQLTSTGALTGTVTNADTSAPIFGALVSAAAPSGSGSALTNASGQYTITNLFSDTYTVTATVFGYAPATATGVNVTNGVTFTHDFQLTPLPILSVAGTSVSDAAGGNGDGVVDPGETIRVNVGLSNSGFATATTVSGTLTLSGGTGTVVNGTSAYAGIAPAATVTNTTPFTIAVSAAQACGQPLTFDFAATYDLAQALTYSFTVPVGTSSTSAPASFSENFDGVTAPAFPVGWTTAVLTGTTPTWVITTTGSASVPNNVFASDPATITLKELVSLPFTITTTAAKLIFRNNYVLENNFDGGVLEVKIGSGAFTDILAAGGSFASGGYNSTISANFGNPLGGRSAWTGTSFGYITTTVNLPASAAGQSVQLRWLVGTDSSLSAAGQHMDDVAIVDGIACAPVLSKTVSADTVAPAQLLTYTLTVMNPGTAASANLTLTDTLPAQVTYVGSSGGGVHSGNVVTWSVGSLAGGVTLSRTLTVLVNADVPPQVTLTNTFSGAGPNGFTTISNAALTQVLWRLFVPLVLR